MAGRPDQVSSYTAGRIGLDQVRRRAVCVSMSYKRKASSPSYIGTVGGVSERSAMLVWVTRDCTTAHVWLRYSQIFMSADRFSVEYRTDQGGDRIRLRSRLIG